jgi:hypothetical protein
MISLALLLVTAPLRGDHVPDDTLRPPRAVIAAVPWQAQERDTIPRRRRRSIEVSEWYHRRLVIHRALSYATIPLFTTQYVAGEKLFEQGSAAPGWAKTTHRVGATTLAGVFTVNTVTGLWNLWDSREVESHRGLRAAHALMMLTADAAFTYAGVKLSEDAEQSQAKRSQHRTVAISAMGLTAVSGVLMKVLNK